MAVSYIQDIKIHQLLWSPTEIPQYSREYCPLWNFVYCKLSFYTGIITLISIYRETFILWYDMVMTLNQIIFIFLVNLY